jgi:hypothetical protein
MLQHKNPLVQVLLKHEETERSSMTVVYFHKHTGYFTANSAPLEVVVNRLPEDILFVWIRDFLTAVRTQTGLDGMYFDRKTQLGKVPLSLRYNVYLTDIDVYYITVDRHGTMSPHRYLTIDGTQQSIERCKNIIIDSRLQDGTLHKLTGDVYLSVEQ